MNNFPEVMHEAREDLRGGNVRGHFSDEDWSAILARARVLLENHPRFAEDPRAAWTDVVRAFHAEGYWGFRPIMTRRPARPKKDKKGLGVSFIIIGLTTATITKIAVLWMGQIYARSDDAADMWLFYGVILLVLANFAYFLWRTRHHRD